MSTLEVFNLEFPSHCHSFEIGGYRFSRVENYRERLQSLNHTGNFFSEFDIKRNTGQNSITANVELISPESEGVFPLVSKDHQSTGLDDVFLILTLFTSREVFARRWAIEDECLSADPRYFAGGGILRCSLPYVSSSHRDLLKCYDQGFIDGLNSIHALINEPDWRMQYKDGRFLILARDAFKHQPFSVRFALSWTIWEHLYSVFHESTKAREEIERTPAFEKIKFIMHKFSILPDTIVDTSPQLRALAKIRNSVIHYGVPPEQDHVWNDMLLMTRLTEFVIARTLGIKPSNVLNTEEELLQYLNRNMSIISAEAELSQPTGN